MRKTIKSSIKVLGIDYGERYIGIAIADCKIGIAIPKLVLQNSGKKVLKQIFKDLIEKNGIKRIVIGLPLSFSMQHTTMSKKIKRFARYLKKEFKVPVDFENEILSTSYAKRIYPGVSKEVSHSIAAALILQSWLDRYRNKF